MTMDRSRRKYRYSFGAAISRWAARGCRFFLSLSAHRLAQLCLGSLVPQVLAGCSMSFPISPLVTVHEDTTGAIPQPAMAKLLEPEDWRRAKAALSTALDPQGNGSMVGWENPDSGNKGSFTPVGNAYPQNSEICRVFLAEVHSRGDAQTLRGTACSEKGEEWVIAEAKPWKKI